MKNLKHLFTALLLLSATMAFAEEVTINGIKYDVITKAKQATVISGDTKYSGNIVIPSEITYNNVTCSVTNIGSGAFYDCDGLTSITIPNSVTSIEDYAFYSCSGLTSITIPNSVTSIGDNAFYGCSGLESIVVDPGNTKYDNRDNCNAIIETESNTLITGCKNTVIPNSVTSIGEDAFSNCSGLTSITIPNSITSIGSYAFYGCSELTSITIPNSVTSIGSSAFNRCAGLTSVTIGNSVTSIGKQAFQSCTGLTSITIPNSVTSIESYAFYKCSGLTSITIPNSVTSIGKQAFQSCSGLTSVTIPNSVTSIGENAFRDCYGLTSVTIGNSVTSIGQDAFRDCYGLTSVTIGNSVTSIGSFAFWGCSGLTSITIGNSVTSIGYDAFYNCSGLTSVTIGSGVVEINGQAFAKCENLTDVCCLATKVPSTQSDAFNESYPEYMTLHVPAEAIDSYKTTAPWSSFGNIVAINGGIVEPEVPEEPEVKICATPTISYSNGKIAIECETDGAEFITTVTNMYSKTYYTNIFDLSATYNISVYAMANGYDNSDTVNATLCWIENGNIDNETNVINIPAKAVFITSRNGELSINCALDGESVEVYTTGGVLVGRTTIANGNATIQSSLSKGSVAIIKVGNKSVKAIID